MHELSITRSILDSALRHASAAGAVRVTDLYLVAGQLAPVAADSLQFSWEILSRGTPAEGARLHIRRVPAEWRCGDCGRRYTAADGDCACPDCGSATPSVVAGQELYLETIEVEPEA